MLTRYVRAYNFKHNSIIKGNYHYYSHACTYIRCGAAVSVRTQGKFDRRLKPVDLIIANAEIPDSLAKEAKDNDKFVVKTVNKSSTYSIVVCHN